MMIINNISVGLIFFGTCTISNQVYDVEFYIQSHAEFFIQNHSLVRLIHRHVTSTLYYVIINHNCFENWFCFCCFGYL